VTDTDHDAARFEAVLDELRRVLIELQGIGVGAVLIGGQVLALESRAAGGSGTIQVRTTTGVQIDRGYSMEPDLLLDVDDVAPRADAIPDVLRRCGFGRLRGYRWRKTTGRGEVLLDLFVAPDTDATHVPGDYTRLPGGELALARPQVLRLRVPSGMLEVLVPDPVGFLATKVEAKRHLRPSQTKDSFDLYAYVAMRGVATVAEALRRDDREGPRIEAQLRALFGGTEAEGVRDVLAYAGSLGEEERTLLARAVVDLFDDLERASGGDAVPGL
jgi:hypothetical protein